MKEDLLKWRLPRMVSSPLKEVDVALADRLGVVMPCYNEALTVGEIIRRVLAQDLVAELIIVDDGSTDASWALLQEWPPRDPRVRLLRHARNIGKGAAVRRGFAASTASVVVVQDADLECDPADFSRMFEPIQRNEASVVYGSRFPAGAKRATTRWHWLCNWLLTQVANGVTGQRLTDQATCYKMFRRDILIGLNLEEDGFGICPELTAKISRQGTRILEVPIRYEPRSYSMGKKLRLRDGCHAVLCLLKYSFQKR